MLRRAAPDTLIAHLRQVLTEGPDGPAVCWPARSGSPGRSFHRRALWTEAARLARALHEEGLTSGECVLLLSENSERWLICDLALQGLGCPVVPRGTSAPAEEICYILEKVRARFVVLENSTLLGSVCRAGQDVQTVLLLSAEAGVEAPPGFRVLGLAALTGQRAAEDCEPWFEEEIARRRPEDVATIVFTSGTTGKPKGVMLTQRNLRGNLTQFLGIVEFLRGSSTCLSILPSWHMFERIVEYAVLDLELCIVYSDRRHFAADVTRLQPRILAAVPRIWILLMERALAEIQRAPALPRLLARLALFVGRHWVLARNALRGWVPHPPGESPLRRAAPVLRALPRLGLLPAFLVLEPLVLRRLRQRMGLASLRRGAAISGGGSLPYDVDLFFAGLGIRLLNGYGLTETSPVLCVRRPERNALGSVGPPLPDTELLLRDPETLAEVPPGSQGVVFVRGPQVMRGYFEDPGATAAVLSEEGWFNTGDLGRLSSAGELLLTGRAKDTIVLLSGENIDPEPLETALVGSPMIRQAVVVGQDQKFLGALIVPNYDGTGVRDAGHVEEALRRVIDERINPRRGFRRHERIVRFAVLEEPFSPEDGSLSQTLKIKRDVVSQRHASRIAALFRDDPAR